MITVTGSKAVDCIPDVNAQFNLIQLLPPLERFHFVLSGGLGRLNHDYHTYLKEGPRLPTVELEFELHEDDASCPIKIKTFKVYEWGDHCAEMKKGQSNVLKQFVKEDIMRNVRHLKVSHCYESEMFAGISMMDLEQCDTPSTLKRLDSLLQCCFGCFTWCISYEKECYSCRKREINSFEYEIQCQVREKAQAEGNSCCHKWFLIQEILRWCGDCILLNFAKSETRKCFNFKMEMINMA